MPGKTEGAIDEHLAGLRVQRAKDFFEKHGAVLARRRGTIFLVPGFAPFAVVFAGHGYFFPRVNRHATNAIPAMIPMPPRVSKPPVPSPYEPADAV